MSDARNTAPVEDIPRVASRESISKRSTDTAPITSAPSPAEAAQGVEETQVVPTPTEDAESLRTPPSQADNSPNPPPQASLRAPRSTTSTPDQGLPTTPAVNASRPRRRPIPHRPSDRVLAFFGFGRYADPVRASISDFLRQGGFAAVQVRVCLQLDRRHLTGVRWW